MENHTFQMIEAALKLDQTISPARRKNVLRTLTSEPSPAPVPDGNGHSPRIYSRAEAAKLLGGKSCRFVDLLARKGLLKKFIAPGSKRAIGVLGVSLHRFIEGTPSN